MVKNSSLLETTGAEGAQAPAVERSDAVKDFLQRTGTEELAETAIRLVCELFPQPHTIELGVSRDFEENSEWLVVRVTAHANRQALTAAYREYVARWVRETPADKRHFVCL